jgi:thioredoxin-like negative regulator of GroEL
VKVDPRERPDLAKEYGVTTIPAYFVDGKPVNIYRQKE